MALKNEKFGNIREMLSKDQMKKIKGGQGWLYKCCTNDYSSCTACTYQVTDPCPLDMPAKLYCFEG